MTAAQADGRVAVQLAHVVANAVVNPEYRHLILRCVAPATEATPGQFFQLLCPAASPDAPFLRRPMSVYGIDPDNQQIEFLYKVTGAGTRGLASLGPGDTLDIMGPLGCGFVLDPGWRHIVAVGRGAGLATLGPLAALAHARGIGVTAVLSARRPELAVGEALFRKFGVAAVVVTDSEGTSGPGNIERLLRRLIAAGRCDAFFTCGSARLLRVQQRLAREFAIPGQVAYGTADGVRAGHVLLLRARIQCGRRDHPPACLLRGAGVRYVRGVAMTDLTVRIGDLTLANPVMPASGTFAEGLARVFDLDRLGALVTKTITRELRIGNPLPRVAETHDGMLNAIGIPSKGVPYFLEHTLPEMARWKVAAGGEHLGPDRRGLCRAGRCRRRPGDCGDRGEYLLPQYRGGWPCIRHECCFDRDGGPPPSRCDTAAVMGETHA